MRPQIAIFCRLVILMFHKTITGKVQQIKSVSIEKPFTIHQQLTQNVSFVGSTNLPESKQKWLGLRNSSMLS